MERKHGFHQGKKYVQIRVKKKKVGKVKKTNN